jgi:hypothetical protein
MRFSFEQTFSFWFPYQNSASLCLLCNACQTLFPLHPPAFDHPTVWWAVQSWSSISCDTHHFSVTASSFGTNTFLNSLFSTTRILYSYLRDRNKFLLFHPFSLDLWYIAVNTITRCYIISCDNMFRLHTVIWRPNGTTQMRGIIL